MSVKQYKVLQNKYLITELSDRNDFTLEFENKQNEVDVFYDFLYEAYFRDVFSYIHALGGQAYTKDIIEILKNRYSEREVRTKIDDMIGYGFLSKYNLYGKQVVKFTNLSCKLSNINYSIQSLNTNRKVEFYGFKYYILKKYGYEVMKSVVDKGKMFYSDSNVVFILLMGEPSFDSVLKKIKVILDQDGYMGIRKLRLFITKTSYGLGLKEHIMEMERKKDGVLFLGIDNIGLYDTKIYYRYLATNKELNEVGKKKENS